MNRVPLRRLARDRKGATLVEFAFVAPVLCLFMVGGFDIAHSLYMQADLEGIMQKTGRDSALETGTETARQAAIDDRVRAQVRALASNATITFTRRYYRTFSKALAAQFEAYTDTNGDGTCNAGEPYTDANNNSTWDSDGGDGGQGGAKDKTVYTVRVSYPRMLPLHRFIPGLPDTTVLSANTVLQNQPYSDQASYTVTNTVRNCA